METPKYVSWSEMQSTLDGLKRFVSALSADLSRHLTPQPTIRLVRLLDDCLSVASGMVGYLGPTLEWPSVAVGLPSPAAASAAVSQSCPAGATASPSGPLGSGQSPSPGQKSHSPASEVILCPLSQRPCMNPVCLADASCQLSGKPASAQPHKIAGRSARSSNG